MKGDEEVDAADFVDFFPEARLPFVVADSTLKRKSADSAIIAWSVFTGFVPDTIFSKDFGKSKPKLYALGRAREKGKETYLFLKAVQGNRQAAYVLAFDKERNFLNHLLLIKTGSGNFTSMYGRLDQKYQVTTYRERRVRSEIVSFKRNVYIYNSASAEFTLILTEPNVEIIENIINPIDTLPQKHKYTGDYRVNKKNFISFRDGRNTSEILFFVHFEKDRGECVGELKGTAKFVSSKTAVYQESGNPCRLEFEFGSTSVTMKEEGCGSYRDIRCFFEGSYPRVKKKPGKKAG